MRKETLVSINFECSIISIKNEKHLKIKADGLSLKQYSSNKVSYANKKAIELILPIWIIPYFLREQRKSIAGWEEHELRFIKQIKSAYNTEVIREAK